MATIRPFCALHPASGLEARTAALPYDVYNRAEARIAAAKDPLSFLNIDRPETQFPPDEDMYSDAVYEKARELLQSQIDSGIWTEDEAPHYYLYELTMDGRSQTGIVACASIDDYVNGVIKKHENTREEKEADRIRHVDVCSAQTGPIFLAYRSHPVIREVVSQVKAGQPAFDFVSEDGIGHRGWTVSDPQQAETIRQTFSDIDSIYIADGHHRAASAVKVGLKRRQACPDYTGEEEFNYFLSVLFPDEELMIMDYNRVVKDLGGMDEAAFLERLGAVAQISKEEEPVRPSGKGEFGLYLGETWYRCRFPEALRSSDPVEGLDVSLLQKYVLQEILGIDDPRIDPRIDFVGGIRGLSELERRVKEDCRAAFSMYPTSIAELFAVADAGLLMPPKSTWFEPKLRSGLYIHRF